MKTFKNIPIDFKTFEHWLITSKIKPFSKRQINYVSELLELNDYMDLSDILYTDQSNNLYTFDIAPPENCPSMF